MHTTPVNETLQAIRGIHHVTAVAGDPTTNAEFYAGVLGLRLVKRTVNFDDPGTYHLYYGDAVGNPGSIVTFFPWPGALRGRHGVGQLTVTSFLVPETSMGYWLERLKASGIPFEGPENRFDEETVSFRDPDGLILELVARAGAATVPGWEGGPVPPERAIQRFGGVTLAEGALEETAALLDPMLGFRRSGESGNRVRFEARDGDRVTGIDLLHLPATARGHVAVGTVHHVAWRTPDAASQEAWRQRLVDAGFQVTPVVDRCYFQSIYFREPGGVLFEIATDPPGFAVDEPVQRLGEKLTLPPWLEPSRESIERTLPPFRLPVASRG